MGFNCPGHAKVPGVVMGLLVLRRGSGLRRRRCEGYLLRDTDPLPASGLPKALLLLAWWGLLPPLSSAQSIPSTSAMVLCSPPQHQGIPSPSAYCSLLAASWSCGKKQEEPLSGAKVESCLSRSASRRDHPSL